MLPSPLGAGIGSDCTDQAHVDFAVGSAVMQQQTEEGALARDHPAAVVGYVCDNVVGGGAEARGCGQKSVIGCGYLDEAPQLLCLVNRSDAFQYDCFRSGPVTTNDLVIDSREGAVRYQVKAFVYNPRAHYTVDLMERGRFWHADPIHWNYCPYPCSHPAEHPLGLRDRMKHDHFHSKVTTTHARASSRSPACGVCVGRCVNVVAGAVVGVVRLGNKMRMECEMSERDS